MNDKLLPVYASGINHLELHLHRLKLRKPYGMVGMSTSIC